MRNVLWRRRLRTDQRWDEGVGDGGGHLGSSTVVWSSLASDSPVSLCLPRGETEDHARWRTVTAGEATRADGGGPLDRPPPEKNPVRGVFGKYSRTQHLLWRGDSILVSDTPLPDY
jgi:hypothetical protein